MKIDVLRTSLILTLILLVVSVGAFADDKVATDAKETKETKEMPDLKKMKGKDLFITFCKVCHGEDSEAGEYTPMFLIMEQWEEFFDGTYQETHKELVCPKDKKTKVIDVIDKDMLKKIEKFCVDHAADSEQPMTCG